MAYIVFMKGRETEIGRASFLADACSVALDTYHATGRACYVEDNTKSIYESVVYTVGPAKQNGRGKLETLSGSDWAHREGLAIHPPLNDGTVNNG